MEGGGVGARCVQDVCGGVIDVFLFLFFLCVYVGEQVKEGL